MEWEDGKIFLEQAAGFVAALRGDVCRDLGVAGAAGTRVEEFSGTILQHSSSGRGVAAKFGAGAIETKEVLGRIILRWRRFGSIEKFTSLRYEEMVARL